jgi:hypothetical protein
MSSHGGANEGGGGGGVSVHADLLGLAADDHLQYYNNARMGLIRPGEAFYVSPNYSDDDVLRQYGTLQAALAKATAYTVANPTKTVLVIAETAIHPVTDKLSLTDRVGLYFRSYGTLDFSGWTGGNVMCEAKGQSLVFGLNMIAGIFGPHPFTGGKFFEVQPNIGGNPTQFVLDRVWLWDFQGGATVGLDILHTPSSEANESVVFLIGGVTSVASSIGTIRQTGRNSLTIEGGKQTCLLGDVIQQVDYDEGGGSWFGPSTSISTNFMQQLGTEYIINKSTHGVVDDLRGAFLDIAKCNNLFRGDGFDKMLNSKQIWQDQVPHPDYADPESYELRRGLEWLRDRRDMFTEASEGESTTTLATVQDKVQMIFTPKEAGLYKIEWSAEVTADGTNRTCDVVVQQGTAGVIHAQTREQVATANYYKQISGFAWVSLLAVGQDFRLKFGASAGGTAKIRRARMTAHLVQ